MVLDRELEQILEKADPDQASRLQDEQAFRVAFLGPEFSHSFDAASQVFPAMFPVPCRSFRRAFEVLLYGEADFAVVPFENSSAGSVAGPLQEFFWWTDRDRRRRVLAVGQHTMLIKNYLATAQPASLADVKRSTKVIRTIAVAHQQCEDNLQRDGLDDRVQHVASTSEAARMTQDDPEAAAICSLSAVEHFGLHVVDELPINDDPTNFTRFLTLAVVTPEGERATPAALARGFSMLPPSPPASPGMSTIAAGDDDDVSVFFVVLRDITMAQAKFVAMFPDPEHQVRHVNNTRVPQRMQAEPEFKQLLFFEVNCSMQEEWFNEMWQKLEKRADLARGMKLVGSFKATE